MDAPLTENERKAARYVVPPPEVPSTPIDPSHPGLPRSVRSAANAARRAGRAPEVYWARGPRLDARGAVIEAQVDTLGLRVVVEAPTIVLSGLPVRPRRLVVMMWRMKPDGDWVFDAAYLTPGRVRQVEGAEYRLRVDKIDARAATEIIKEGA